jgi:YVTN family beta-propeller protein
VITVGSNPGAIAVNSTTNKVYVANTGATTGLPATVSVIDGSTNTVTATVTVGAYPVAVAVSEALNQIYVANRTSNTVTIIDGTTNATTTVPVGSLPVSVTVNTANQDVYVANTGNNTVSIISGTGVSHTIATSPNPGAVAVDPVSNRVYVGNVNWATTGTTITAVGGDTYTSASVPVNVNPTAIVANPKTNLVYVVNSASHNVSVIDGSNPNLPIIGTLATPAGYTPVAVVANPLNSKIYVASTTGPPQNTGVVSIFSEAAYSQTDTMTLGYSAVQGAAVPADIDLATHQVYVANSYDHTISVID